MGDEAVNIPCLAPVNDGGNIINVYTTGWGVEQYHRMGPPVSGPNVVDVHDAAEVSEAEWVSTVQGLPSNVWGWLTANAAEVVTRDQARSTPKGYTVGQLLTWRWLADKAAG